MTAPVPLGLCGCAFQGRLLASEIGFKRADANSAAAIIDIGARLRARVLLRCGGLNEANGAVHTVLWRLLHHGADLAAMSENDLQAALNKILQT
jgi:hypothetical protein